MGFLKTGNFISKYPKQKKIKYVKSVLPHKSNILGISQQMNKNSKINVELQIPGLRDFREIEEDLLTSWHPRCLFLCFQIIKIFNFCTVFITKHAQYQILQK